MVSIEADGLALLFQRIAEVAIPLAMQSSSRAEESHPHPLLDPDVNVAIHPAPDVQPCFKGPVRE
jgi:hypothetical protein